MSAYGTFGPALVAAALQGTGGGPPALAWFDLIARIASGLVSIGLVALIVFSIPIILNVRRSIVRITALLEQFHADVTPLIQRARSIAENVDQMSKTVRGEVEQITGTISLANSTVQNAVATTERRVNELNALISVVQEEAEGLFVSTAAAVRGAKHGASQFVSGAGPELASMDEDDGLDAAATEETDDGPDSPDDPSDPDFDDTAPPAPRIRRRNRASR